MLLATGGFILFAGYGLLRHKGIGGSLLLGVAGSLVGTGVGIFMQAPKRIE